MSAVRLRAKVGAMSADDERADDIFGDGVSDDELGDTHAGPAESGDEESDHFVHAGAPSDVGAALFAVLAPRDTDARLRANAGLRAQAGCEASVPGGVADMLAVAARKNANKIFSW